MIPYWLTKVWWVFIFQPVNSYYEAWLIYRLKVYVCRWRGHPHGVVFYNANGFEPDMHCKNCGDDLG